MLKPLFIFLYFFSSCSEEPIYNDLSNIDNNIDTLLITDISGYNYQISPDISGYNKLFVGSKEEFTFLSSLFNFPSNSWDTFFDSTVTVDSIFFKVFSGDSLIENNPNLNLYFSTDSIFDESNSLVSELRNVAYDEWVNGTDKRWHMGQLMSACADLMGCVARLAYAHLVKAGIRRAKEGLGLAWRSLHEEVSLQVALGANPMPPIQVHGTRIKLPIIKQNCRCPNKM